MNLPERDDRRGQLVEAEETAVELLVPHEQFAEASEPTMRGFHHPSSGSLRRISALLSGFLSAPFDVRDESMFLYDLPCRHAGIARIGTQVLAPPRRWCGTLDQRCSPGPRPTG